MTIKGLKVSFLALGISAGLFAQTPGKVGIINIQQAIVSTKDGQKAAAELDTKTSPKRKELEKKQSEIQSLRDQLQRGSNTMSEDNRQKLVRDIDTKTKALNRDVEDAQAEFDQEQQKVLQELGGKMMAVIDKYAKENGYTLILDVSSPQTPVLYAATGIDVTTDIVGLYDKSAASVSGAPAAAPASPAPPAAPKKPAPAK